MTEDDKKENEIDRKDSKISQGTNMNTEIKDKKNDETSWFHKICDRWKINTNLIMLKITLFVLYGGM